jgi:hypothetical protein
VREREPPQIKEANACGVVRVTFLSWCAYRLACAGLPPLVLPSCLVALATITRGRGRLGSSG